MHRSARETHATNETKQCTAMTVNQHTWSNYVVWCRLLFVAIELRHYYEMSTH